MTIVLVSHQGHIGDQEQRCSEKERNGLEVLSTQSSICDPDYLYTPELWKGFV